jgi:hypothetical protein
MDKLEHYLDQVCRSIGGPKAMRQHVRQELREHLLDAVAEHKAAGMTEDAALDKALEEFGKPDEVRGELEAAHGHRLLPVVIDKAMQWKEKTMRAKWLWTTWAYLAVVLVIVLELLSIAFTQVFLLPKMQKIRSSDLLTFDDTTWPAIARMFSFLDGLQGVGERLAQWLLLFAVALWGLFEWRVRSENKPFMRLAALGTVAVGLLIVVVFTAASLELPFMVGMPQIARERNRSKELAWIERLDTSVRALEAAQAKKDWQAMRQEGDRAAEALTELEPNLYTLTPHSEIAEVAELRTHLKDAKESFQEVLQAIRDKDAEQMEAALKKYHKAFEPIREAAKRSPK